MKSVLDYILEELENKIVGIVGETSEDGIVFEYIRQNDEKWEKTGYYKFCHGYLKPSSKGYNQYDAIRYKQVGWRYSVKSKTLYIWHLSEYRHKPKFKIAYQKTVDYLEDLHYNVKKTENLDYNYTQGHLFEEVEKPKPLLGLVGYATEDGIAYINVYEGHEDHQLLMSRKVTPKGPNAFLVKQNIKHMLDTNDGMSTSELAGFRYVVNDKTLYFWFSDVTDPLLKEYVEDFIKNKLRFPVVKVRSINHWDSSYATSHFK